MLSFVDFLSQGLKRIIALCSSRNFVKIRFEQLLDPQILREGPKSGDHMAEQQTLGQSSEDVKWATTKCSCHPVPFLLTGLALQSSARVCGLGWAIYYHRGICPLR